MIAAVSGLAMASIYHQTDYSAPPISLILGAASAVPLLGAGSILLVPMKSERRNVLGFLTLVTTLPLLYLVFVMADWLATHLAIALAR